MINEFFNTILKNDFKGTTLKELLTDYSKNKKYIANGLMVHIKGKTFDDFGVLTCLPGSIISFPIRMEKFQKVLFELGFKKDYFELYKELQDSDLFIGNGPCRLENGTHWCYRFDLQKVINKYMRQ